MRRQWQAPHDWAPVVKQAQVDSGTTDYLQTRSREREKRESGLASTCCTPLSVSNPLVRRFWCLSLSMSMVPECWHGDECAWHKRGRCLLKHCAPPSVELTGGDVPVEQQLRDLRRALQSGHVERRRTHTASRERHSRDDDRDPGHRCDSATDYGRAPGAHLGARARTDRRCQCPSLNLETKHVEVPQTPYLDKVPVYACRDAKTGPSTVDQPGDQARRVHTEFIHR